jgi:hypothetical protein
LSGPIDLESLKLTDEAAEMRLHWKDHSTQKKSQIFVKNAERVSGYAVFSMVFAKSAN